MLSYPRFHLEFILDTDASDRGTNAVLSQVQDGEEKVIAYASRTLSKAEQNYSMTKREMLAFVYYMILPLRSEICRQNRPRCVTVAYKLQGAGGQVACWLEKLADFDFQVQSRHGIPHGNADGLSRRPSEGVNQPNQDPVVSKVPERASTAADLRSQQIADPVISHVLGWRETQTEPPLKSELKGFSQRVYNLCTLDALEVQEGMLYRHWENEGGTVAKSLLVASQSLVNKVLTDLHDAPTTGHLGVTKTLAKLRQQFYWPNQRQDVVHQGIHWKE